MRNLKPSLILASLGVVGLALLARGFVDATGSQMAESAGRFLVALDDSQKAQATFGFDDAERLNWHFIPRPRKGLPVKAMTPAQRALAFGLIQSGLGGSGFLKATTIMSLEAILKDLEQGKGPVRDPELYYLSIFGTPAPSGKWGWRVEGHHLSLNFTIENGAIVSASPAFFGSNPGEVRQGPRQGLRALADLEDRALRLLLALDDAQKKIAVTAEKGPGRDPGTEHPAATHRRGRGDRLRPAHRRPEADAPGPRRVVCLGHGPAGRSRLARRDQEGRSRKRQVRLDRRRRPERPARVQGPGPRPS